MGSRIEISLEEYTSLKTENQRLYQITSTQEEKMKVLNQKIETIYEFLEEIVNLTFYERLFEWKHIQEIINGFFKRLPKINQTEKTKEKK